ncbi:MAG TPA: tetratricopeptide repeat protein [Polyangiaceae bacterium]|nr:tetratricopeptide repeat protein [Polyangiaceae bacterium]
MPMVEPLSPWAEGLVEDSPLDRRIAGLFAALPEPAPLSDVARQRVAIRLRSRTTRGGRLMLVRLIVIGMVIGMAGAAAAQWATTHFFHTQRELVTPRMPVAVERPPLVPQPSLPLLEQAPPSAAPEPPPVEPAAAAPLGAVAPAASSRLGLEATSLEAALSALRAGGKSAAQQALSRLDQHLRDFPHGTLELEARVARVDALLVLGRRHEAKHELSAMPIENVGRNRELRLIRAELHADDDCREALADFQFLVEQGLPDAWRERALFGRGACLLRLGDGAGAERDFARYLELYPVGRFAEQIRAQRAR